MRMDLRPFASYSESDQQTNTVNGMEFLNSSGVWEMQITWPYNITLLTLRWHLSDMRLHDNVDIRPNLLLNFTEELRRRVPAGYK